MAHPLRALPLTALDDYLAMGLLAIARKHRAAPVTVRRWLADRGVTIRKQGLRAGFSVASAAAGNTESSSDTTRLPLDSSCGSRRNGTRLDVPGVSP